MPKRDPRLCSKRNAQRPCRNIGFKTKVLEDKDFLLNNFFFEMNNRISKKDQGNVEGDPDIDFGIEMKKENPL